MSVRPGWMVECCASAISAVASRGHDPKVLDGPPLEHPGEVHLGALPALAAVGQVIDDLGVPTAHEPAVQIGRRGLVRVGAVGAESLEKRCWDGRCGRLRDGFHVLEPRFLEGRVACVFLPETSKKGQAERGRWS